MIVVIYLFYNFHFHSLIREHNEGIGLSKPQNDSVKQKVEHPNVEYDHNEVGFQNPRNGVAPDNIEAKTYCPISNGKVRVERDILEITNNIFAVIS